MSEAQARQENLTFIQSLRMRWRHRLWPRLYHVPGYGVAYRIIMRTAHRMGWHYAPRQYPIDASDAGNFRHHCQWCGLRGTTLNMEWNKQNSALIAKGQPLPQPPGE